MAGGAATGDDGGLVARVAQVLDDIGVPLSRGATAVVAVSGGQDSVALLHIVAAARPDLALVVGHVRHGLRDDHADAAAARANAAALDLRYIERAATAAGGAGPEDSARRARYAALRDIARACAAAVVLVGHTMDDQAETVMLRLARGTGIAGLAGMEAVTSSHGVPVVRPLLAERRTTVRAAAAGHPTIEDPTNADPDQRRARARREALPALSRLHPAEADVVPLLARLADFARPHRRCSASDASVDIGGEPAQPAASPERFGMAVQITAEDRGRMTGSALRRGWSMLPGAPQWPGPGVLRRLSALDVGQSVDLPGGVTAARHPGGLVLCRVDTPALPSVTMPEGVWIAIPGFGSLRAAAGVDGTSRAAPTRGTWRAWSWTVELAGDHLPLVLRGRSPDGDRTARRTLQTFPLPLRRQVPLVVDAAGRVLMVGHHVLVPPRPGGPTVRLEADPRSREGPSVGYPPPP